MASLKFSLFDEDDPQQWKAFENAMAKAFVRAMRVVAKENLVAGYAPPPAEVVPADPMPPPETEFGAHLNGGNVGDTRPEPEADNGKKRQSWKDTCEEVFRVPDGFISIEKACDRFGGDRAAAMTSIRHWVQKGQVQAVILVGSRQPRSHGLNGHLMVDERQFSARDALRRQRAEQPAFKAKVNAINGHKLTRMPTGIPAAAR